MPDPRPVPVPTSIDARTVPQHIAVVMDGDGRWAEQRGLPRTEGHGAGEKALVDTTYGALSLGVKALTVYAFSTRIGADPLTKFVT